MTWPSCSSSSGRFITILNVALLRLRQRAVPTKVDPAP